jgi:hypothetical protein
MYKGYFCHSNDVCRVGGFTTNSKPIVIVIYKDKDKGKDKDKDKDSLAFTMSTVLVIIN